MPGHLPAEIDVRRLLVDLLGRDVALHLATPFAPGPKLPATFAVYVDDAMRIAAVVTCDLAFSARAGAALGLVPTRVVQRNLEAGSLDETLRENLYEVLNVTAALFNLRPSAHLRLHTVHHVGDPVPPRVHALALTLGRRLDVGLDVAGYGHGRLSFVMIDGPV
jgi:hypothetical protein